MNETESKNPIELKLAADLRVHKDLNGVRLEWTETAVSLSNGKIVAIKTVPRREQLYSSPG